MAALTAPKARGSSLFDRLAGSGTLIADGATGTYLQARGLEPGGDPEAMNMTHPQIVRGMAEDYLRAGSDLVQTNSFGGSRFVQGKYGYGDRAGEFCRLAAQHAGSAVAEVSHAAFVAGSIGPTGELIQPVGETHPDDALSAFAEQAVSLEQGGADLAVIETMFSVEEARLAVQAVKENTDLPVAALATFDKGPRGFFTMMGETPRVAAAELARCGADIVGTNCGNGIDLMVELGAMFRAETDLPVWVNSNAGIPSIRQGQLVYPEGPQVMAEGFVRLAELGVNIIGGCCGTTPSHISALVAALRGQ